MNCLICQKKLVAELSLKDIVQMKKKEARTCDDCFLKYVPISKEHCQQCWKPNTEGTCDDCIRWQQEGQKIDHQAIFTYNQAMREYFSSYKFMGDYMLRSVFGNVLKEKLTPYKEYTIVPIPISEKKYAQRKFNQVIGMLESAGIKFEELLWVDDSKKKDQSSKTRKERLETKQFFKIKSNTQLPSKLLIVDDVYTTGKTLQLAKQCLLEGGAVEVKTFSVAR